MTKKEGLGELKIKSKGRQDRNGRTKKRQKKRTNTSPNFKKVGNHLARGSQT